MYAVEGLAGLQGNRVPPPETTAPVIMVSLTKARDTETAQRKSVKAKHVKPG